MLSGAHEVRRIEAVLSSISAFCEEERERGEVSAHNIRMDDI